MSTVDLKYSKVVFRTANAVWECLHLCRWGALVLVGADIQVPSEWEV